MPRGVYTRAPQGEATQSANVDLMRDAIRAVWNPLSIQQKKDVLNRIGWKTTRIAHFDIDKMTEWSVAGLYRDRVKVNQAVSDMSTGTGVIQDNDQIDLNLKKIREDKADTIQVPVVAAVKKAREYKEYVLVEFIPQNVKPYNTRKIGNITDVEVIETAVERRLNILLVGETGTGKTHVLSYVAQEMKMPYFRANLNGAITPDDLIGQWVPSEGGNGFKWQDGILTRFVKNGGLFVADEINFAKPDILAFLNSLLDDDRFIVLYPHEGERIQAHPDFVFAAAMNPSTYQGTRALNMALQDRFDVALEFELTPTLQKTMIPDRKLLDFKRHVDELVQRGDIRGSLSMRGMLQYVQNKELFGPSVAREILLRKFHGAGLEAVKHQMEILLGRDSVVGVDDGEE